MALSSCSLLVNHIHITNQTTHSIVPSKFKRLDCARVVHEKTSCLVVFIRKSRVSKFSCHLHASYVYKTLMSGSENPEDFPCNSVGLQLYRPQNWPMSTYHCAKRTFDLRIRAEIYLEVPNLRINYFFLGLKETSKLTEIDPSIHKKLRHYDSNNSSSKHLNQTKECSGIIHRCSLQIVWQVLSKQKSFTYSVCISKQQPT